MIPKSFQFQANMAAIYLPLSQSLAFFATSYGSLKENYIFWLERQTALSLCKNHHDTINDHYQFAHASSIPMIHAPPSRRIELPSVTYLNGHLSFTNGRHRSRTWLDFGAEYIPFDSDDVSLKKMFEDGIKIHNFEQATEQTKRLYMAKRYADHQDPFLNAYKVAHPDPAHMSDIIKTARLYAILLNYDVTAYNQQEKSYAALGYERELRRHQGRIQQHNKHLWYRDAIRIALPALNTLAQNGFLYWPKNCSLSLPLSMSERNGTPEEYVTKWASKLPIPVKLGHPAKAASHMKNG